MREGDRGPRRGDRARMRLPRHPGEAGHNARSRGRLGDAVASQPAWSRADEVAMTSRPAR